MTRAPAADQQRLLGVQDLDTKIQQAGHRKSHLEAAQRLTEVRARLEEAELASATAHAELGDVQRELTRAEDEVEKVRARQDRDSERLDSGGGLAKELQALQHELEALARRRSALEDTALAIMERVDGAQDSADAAAAVVDQLQAEASNLLNSVELAYREIDGEIAALAARRAAEAAPLDAALVALYERLRASRGGVGAAALRGATCGGCRLELNPHDLQAIRVAAEDEVVRCEECGRILVRVPGGAV